MALNPTFASASVNPSQSMGSDASAPAQGALPTANYNQPQYTMPLNQPSTFDISQNAYLNSINQQANTGGSYPTYEDWSNSQMNRLGGGQSTQGMDSSLQPPLQPPLSPPLSSPPQVYGQNPGQFMNDFRAQNAGTDPFVASIGQQPQGATMPKRPTSADALQAAKAGNHVLAKQLLRQAVGLPADEEPISSVGQPPMSMPQTSSPVYTPTPEQKYEDLKKQYAGIDPFAASIGQPSLSPLQPPSGSLAPPESEYSPPTSSDGKWFYSSGQWRPNEQISLSPTNQEDMYQDYLARNNESRVPDGGNFIAPTEGINYGEAPIQNPEQIQQRTTEQNNKASANPQYAQNPGQFMNDFRNKFGGINPFSATLPQTTQPTDYAQNDASLPQNIQDFLKKDRAGSAYDAGGNWSYDPTTQKFNSFTMGGSQTKSLAEMQDYVNNQGKPSAIVQGALGNANNAQQQFTSPPQSTTPALRPTSPLELQQDPPSRYTYFGDDKADYSQLGLSQSALDSLNMMRQASDMGQFYYDTQTKTFGQGMGHPPPNIPGQRRYTGKTGIPLELMNKLGSGEYPDFSKYAQYDKGAPLPPTLQDLASQTPMPEQQPMPTQRNPLTPTATPTGTTPMATNPLSTYATTPTTGFTPAPTLNVTPGATSSGSFGQGGVLPNVTTTQQQVTAAPSFYTDYLNQLATRGGQAAQDAQYVGAQPLQEQAFNLASQNVGNYQSTLQNAINLASSVGNTNLAQAIGDVGQANIARNLSPQATAGIVGSGQFGSKRGAQALGDVIANAQLGLTAQQQQAMQQDMANRLSAAQQLGTLANSTQQLGLGDINALSTLGQQQQTIAQNQQLFPMQQLANQSALLRGYNIPTSSSASQTGPGQQGQFQTSPLAQIMSVGTLLGALAKPTADYIDPKTGLLVKGRSSGENILSGLGAGGTSLLKYLDSISGKTVPSTNETNLPSITTSGGQVLTPRGDGTYLNENNEIVNSDGVVQFESVTPDPDIDTSNYPMSDEDADAFYNSSSYD